MSEKEKLEQAKLEAEAGGNVDKIREIIFGGQMRDYDRRFDKLEDRLLKDLDNLRRDQSARFESLEKTLRNEVVKLGERINKEREERQEADKNLNKTLTRELEEAEETTKSKLTALADKLDNEAMEIRSELSNQERVLRDAIRDLRDELSRALDDETSRLSDDKLSRSALADLFTEVSLRLNNQMDLPGSAPDSND